MFVDNILSVDSVRLRVTESQPGHVCVSCVIPLKDRMHYPSHSFRHVLILPRLYNSRMNHIVIHIWCADLISHGKCKQDALGQSFLEIPPIDPKDST